jgi:hypothetical protein
MDTVGVPALVGLAQAGLFYVQLRWIRGVGRRAHLPRGRRRTFVSEVDVRQDR